LAPVSSSYGRGQCPQFSVLFAGSDAGAERAAVTYTLLGCCQLANVDPIAYLTDVLPRLSRRVRIADMPMLLPAQWERSHRASAVAISGTAGA